MVEQNRNHYSICVVGAGHVGLVAAACFACLGHNVICVDRDKEKIDRLGKGKSVFFEPELDQLIKKAKKEKKLRFSSSLAASVKKAEVIFLAVGTPPLSDGSADLTAVESVARTIALNLNSYKLIVEKSTVPAQTGQKIKEVINRYKKNTNSFDVASNPEFLREGKAVYDFFYPDRIVLGVESKRAEKILKNIYRKIKTKIIVTDVVAAEIIKHASNSFLATKISFINAVARICDKAGADVEKVASAMGLDKRIGKDFLKAGVGFGGFCLDKREKIIVKNNKNRIGMVSVEDLYRQFKANQTQVLSFDLNKKNITFKDLALVSKRKYKGKMIKFKTSMGRQITVTADHPMVVYSKGIFSTVCADQVRKKDNFLLFTDFPSLEKKIIIDLFDLLKGADFFDRVKVRPQRSNLNVLPREAFKFLREKRNYKPTRVYDFKRKNYLMLEDYLLLEKFNLIRPLRRQDMLMFTTKGAPTYIKGKFPLDSNILKILGYYVSEGHISSESSLRGVRDRIVFSFNEKEKEYIDELLKGLDRLVLKYRLRNIYQDKVVRITISSKIFAYLIREILKCGNNSYDANVPSGLLSLSKQDKLSFLSALHRGDGSVYFPVSTPSVSYEYGTVSGKLKENMLILLHSIGIVPHLRKFRSSKSTVPVYSIKVSGREQIKSLPFFKDSDTQVKIDSRLASFKRHIKPTGYVREDNNFCSVRVKGIESYYVKDDVYSLEVPGTHTFITSEGIITHNCFPKDVEAFIYISRQLGYDFNLLKEVKNINEKQPGYFIEKIKEHLWILKNKKIAVLGLSFKPDTDDMRFAPSITIINRLLQEGASLRLYDPESMSEAKKIFKKKAKIKFFNEPQEAAKNCDCLCLLTEWEQFKKLNLKKLKEEMNYPLLADGRNFFDKDQAVKLGFSYIGIGR